MNTNSILQPVVGRRAELLAELFLQDLGPVFVSRPSTEHADYDLLVGFTNEKSGINTFAVEVKSTQKSLPRFSLRRDSYDRITHSNVPALLLVVDVKRSRLAYAWLRKQAGSNGHKTVSIPLAEINELTQKSLVQELRRADAA